MADRFIEQSKEIANNFIQNIVFIGIFSKCL